MNDQTTTNYLTFITEATKVTLFCLFITSLFILIGVRQNALLIMFNIAVMSCAATFSPNKKQPIFLLLSSLVIILSVLCGGIIGFYLPNIANILIIIYAILAFSTSKTKTTRAVLATGTIVFLIFTALPFDLAHLFEYGIYSLIFLPLFLLFYWLFDRQIHPQLEQDNLSEKLTPKIRIDTTLILTLALVMSVGCMLFLKHHSSLEHLYWIGLTILVIIQSAQGKTIKTSLVRIGVNTVGALAIVILMTYLMPTNFWINLAFLVILLFLIFALGFSYIARTLCIELFVLSFTHLLGQYHNAIAFDRIILTLIGGLLVICSTLIIYYLQALLKNFT